MKLVFRSGDEVRVTCGIFRGLTATVLWPAPDRNRTVVRIEGGYYIAAIRRVWLQHEDAVTALGNLT